VRSQLVIEPSKKVVGRRISRDSTAAFSNDLDKFSIQPTK
jgi:hypothetical protein